MLSWNQKLYFVPPVYGIELSALYPVPLYASIKPDGLKRTMAARSAYADWGPSDKPITELMLLADGVALNFTVGEPVCGANAVVIQAAEVAFLHTSTV